MVKLLLWQNEDAGSRDNSYLMLQCNQVKEEEKTEWFANQVGSNEFEFLFPSAIIILSEIICPPGQRKLLKIVA